MATTVPIKNGNVEGALKEFTRKTSDTKRKYRSRQDGYLSKGEKRKRAKKEAIKNSRKNKKQDR